MCQPSIVTIVREVFYEGYYAERQNNLIYKYEVLSFK
jgi:hypothetical protein